ncbi:hypothetical protein ABK040_013987 [Willaertia magna]
MLSNNQIIETNDNNLIIIEFIGKSNELQENNVIKTTDSIIKESYDPYKEYPSKNAGKLQFIANNFKEEQFNYFGPLIPGGWQFLDFDSLVKVVKEGCQTVNNSNIHYKLFKIVYKGQSKELITFLSNVYALSCECIFDKTDEDYKDYENSIKNEYMIFRFKNNEYDNYENLNFIYNTNNYYEFETNSVTLPTYWRIDFTDYLQQELMGLDKLINMDIIVNVKKLIKIYNLKYKYSPNPFTLLKRFPECYIPYDNYIKEEYTLLEEDNLFLITKTDGKRKYGFTNYSFEQLD